MYLVYRPNNESNNAYISQAQIMYVWAQITTVAAFFFSSKLNIHWVIPSPTLL